MNATDATPRVLALHHRVAAGLQDKIRHVQYPDEKECARCGASEAKGNWPCPNIAYDELREEIKTLLGAGG
ncbi:hypothetical protein LCGC14_2478200 [marine sediment metagenome]|uniref:Uncharacterized protein n=1 Tax=marine sediment metagenome TaxID=412755 RepID=A0A0F9E259_9ZZZZ